MTEANQELLKTAEERIKDYLQTALKSDKIDQDQYDEALNQTNKNLSSWYLDDSILSFCPSYREGVERYLKSDDESAWESVVNAYRQHVGFGTGGIRGLMAFDKQSILDLKSQGLGAKILRGPNTINEIVILLTSVGVAQFGRSRSFGRVVVGYDSRIQGQALASLVSQLFLAEGYTVFLFEAPCPYPEVTFAIPNEKIKAHVGIFISASHNDYRYNGYKLSCSNGSQFDPDERDQMYNEFIRVAQPNQVQLCPLNEAGSQKLYFLGGHEPKFEANFGLSSESANFINMHELHQTHVKSFLMSKDLGERQMNSASQLKIAHCAFHGAGNEIVPDLLNNVGFQSVHIIRGNDRLDVLDGMFPAFRSEPGEERQPDPGDPRAADIAVSALAEDAIQRDNSQLTEETDIIIGTDPDADRCGIVVNVPEDQEHIYGGSRYLLPADDAWTLLLWYRLHFDSTGPDGGTENDTKFITMSHTTSDALAYLALKHGIGVVKTWVGFASLAAAARDVWAGKISSIADLVEGHNSQYSELCHPFVHSTMQMTNGKRSLNIGAMEQSNGFSILGGPPEDNSSLGRGGHVRDKDGTFAALLVAELAAWAKETGTNLIELLDKHIYLDKAIGLFSTFYEPDPMDGEYSGIAGDRYKKRILLKTLELARQASSGGVSIGGLKVVGSSIFRTGKYDHLYPPRGEFIFPDEGVRFYFDEEQVRHLTVRPSGTGNSLRFHVQLHALPEEHDLLDVKLALKKQGNEVLDDIRRLVGAPRDRQ